MIPDAEKLIGKYLRSETSERVVGKTPDNTDDSWVRLTQLDARTVEGSRSEHLVEAFVQLDCYAGREGGQPEGNALGREIRAVLVDMPNHSHADGVVTGVEIRGHTRIPDADFAPSRERVILTAAVWMHP